MNILSREFFKRDTVAVARDLLGKVLVRHYQGHVLAGIITEVEAYTCKDPACHAYRGKTVRNAALFGPVGHAYVYFIYGNHFCVNAVAHDENHEAGGVLIRAIHPVCGSETMRTLRPSMNIKGVLNGPGKVTQALAITKDLSHADLTVPGPLYIADYGYTLQTIVATPRIGISVAQDLLWRFYTNDFVNARMAPL